MMEYIIERNIDRDRWTLMLPEWRTSEYGVEYLTYQHDMAPSLYDAMLMAYDHRAAYKNWDMIFYVNGKEVLYTFGDDSNLMSIRLADGSTIKLSPSDKYGTIEVPNKKGMS